MSDSNHWKNCKFEDVVRCEGGAAFPLKFQGQKSGDVPFFKVSDMNTPGNSTLLKRAVNYVGEEDIVSLRAKKKPKGSVVFPKVGGALLTNKKRMLEADSLIDNNLMAVWPIDAAELDPWFLYYVWQSIDLAELSNPGPLPSINASTVYERSLSIPALHVQREIVRRLNKICNALEVEADLLRVTRNLKQAVMRKLFTEGLRAEPQKETEIGPVPQTWEEIQLGELVEIEYGAQAAVAANLDPSLGTPILTNVNITINGTVNLSKLRYFEVPSAKKDRLLLRKGDVLFNWRSGSKEHVGKTAIFDEDTEFTYASFILRFRPKDTGPRRISNTFLHYFLTFLRWNEFFSGRRNVSSINSVYNASLAATIPLMVPGMDEQQEIVSNIQAVDRAVRVSETKVKILEELFNAALSKLMSGEVVGKDATVTSALEKIPPALAGRWEDFNQALDEYVEQESATK